MKLITMDSLYLLLGIIVAFVSLRIFLDRNHPNRIWSGLFWGIFAITFLFGKWIPPLIVGYLILGMVIIASLGKVTRSNEAEVEKEERFKHAERLKNKVFIPTLLIPVFTVIGSLTLDKIKFGSIQLVDPEKVTLISLGLAVILAFLVAMYLTRAKMQVPVVEGSRLLQAVGWAVILPQLLASLGGIFAKAEVGKVVSELVSRYLPTQIPIVAVFAYCLGMMLFTMVMGNAFAAFAVITGGIGLPLIVQMHGGNPAVMAALGMFAGYCGTLMTPMAANFNIVPAMLLDLKNKNDVIKAQIPIGISVFILNFIFMYILVFWF